MAPTRQELINFAFSQGLTPISPEFSRMAKAWFQKHLAYATDDERITLHQTSVQQLKNKWHACRKNKQFFLKKEQSWLSKVIQLPSPRKGYSHPHS